MPLHTEPNHVLAYYEVQEVYSKRPPIQKHDTYLTGKTQLGHRNTARSLHHPYVIPISFKQAVTSTIVALPSGIASLKQVVNFVNASFVSIFD